METRWRETLIFELAGRRYGVPASDVQELVRIVTITPPAPGSGPIEGVINLRGSVVPVFDLRARLGLPGRAPDVSESLVIARREGRPFAFRIDRALDLATLYSRGRRVAGAARGGRRPGDRGGQAARGAGDPPGPRVPDGGQPGAGRGRSGRVDRP